MSVVKAEIPCMIISKPNNHDKVIPVAIGDIKATIPKIMSRIPERRYIHQKERFSSLSLNELKNLKTPERKTQNAKIKGIKAILLLSNKPIPKKIEIMPSAKNQPELFFKSFHL